MRSLLLKIFLLALPCLLFLGYVDIRLAHMKTNYSVKREKLEAHLADTETLVLGSSLSYFGIDPACFDHKGFNAAYRGQSYYYDLQILTKYVDRMPKLKMVIVPIIFYTMGIDLAADKGNEYRRYFYYHYSDLPVQRPQSMSFRDEIDPRQFSRIALYGERTADYVLNGFRENIDDVSEDNGWFNAGPVPKDFLIRESQEGARAHSAQVRSETFEDNRETLKKLILLGKSRGITTVLIDLPSHSLYTSMLDPKRLREMTGVVESLAQETGAHYYHYRDDPRFVLSDYMVLIDHLNGDGAKKMSRIINDEIIKPLWPTVVNDERRSTPLPNSK